MSKEMTWEEYADELKAELAKVKQQLSIAVEALELYKQENWSYEDEYINYPCKTGGWIHAEKALQQIKELNK